MPSIIDTQARADRMAAENLLARIKRYTRANSLETVMQAQILTPLRLGPLDSLAVHELRIVLNLLPIAELYRPT